MADPRLRHRVTLLTAEFLDVGPCCIHSCRIDLRTADSLYAWVMREPPQHPDGVPGMGDDQEVRVLSGPGRRDRSEAQGVNREVSTEGSV